MTTIKTEGFKIPGGTNVQHRPHVHRPFSDGSMAVDTDVLNSIEHFSSPFGFPQSLPNQPSIDQYMSSPHPGSVANSHSFHSSFFSNFKMDNPEPPVSFPAAMQEIEERSRSLSANRSHVGKAPSNRSKAARKLSMSETRPVGARGRPPHPHPRTMSFSDSFSNARLGLGVGLDTHQEGHRTDSISPPGSQPNFGVSIPLDSSWTSAAPSLVPGSFGSYGMADEAIMDSPVTPAQPLPTLPTEESYKKQRRRECHNQVEKRRREHINAKIEELSQLLPPNYNDTDEAVEDEEEEESANAAKKKQKKRSGSNAKQPKDTAHCKGRILSHSVQYIFDLKHITELQAARIQHLEALLASTGIPQPSFPWPAGPAMTPFQGINESHLTTLPEHQLEVMRPSPESASPLPAPWHTGRTDLMAYEPSPHSSASVNDFRRSSSLSTSESIEGDVKHAGFKLSPRDQASPILEEFASPHPARKLSDVELQMSMSGMDLDAMFGTRREWQ